MTAELYKSRGPLRYSHREGYGYKLIVEVDPGIVSYYRSMIPKWHDWQAQMYPAHISVVRHEVPINLSDWGRYDGEVVEFEYSGFVHEGSVYWWLNAFSKRLEEVRLGLGLPVSSLYTRPPDSYTKCFHITLCNRKHVPEN